MSKLSEHFTLEESIYSATAIRAGLSNIPTDNEIKNMKLLCEKILEPARKGIGNKSIQIKSFFRSDLVNRLVGGANGSQHSKGQAADLQCFDNKILFDYIKDNLDFDQLIWEHGTSLQPAWVHISYAENNNRKMVLKAIKTGNKTIYKAI